MTVPYLTEDQIERAVEVRTNRLDEVFLHGAGDNYMSQDEYEREIAKIARWADEQYKNARLARRMLEAN